MIANTYFNNPKQPAILKIYFFSFHIICNEYESRRLLSLSTIALSALGPAKNKG
jgi:hypothetical protein